MTDFNEHEEYEINEKDIDSILNFLQIFDPENAKPEKAIAFLQYLRLGVHEIAHSNPEKLEELYGKFKNNSSKE